MTFSLFGGGALETELNLTMKSAVVGVIVTSVTDGWDGGSKKKKKTQKIYRYTIVELQKTFSQNVYCIKCYFRPVIMRARGENKTGEYFPAYSYYPLQLTASAL